MDQHTRPLPGRSGLIRLDIQGYHLFEMGIEEGFHQQLIRPIILCMALLLLLTLLPFDPRF